ncbi:MAG: hypothetical protein WC467_04420 [Patescibacteria group bacterium]
MKSKLLLLGLLISTVVLGQTSQETARDILGDRFVSQAEALTAWHEPNRAELPIPYSVEVLAKCRGESVRGEADYYLVPSLGLNEKQLGTFWSIKSPDLPLKAGQSGWLLINFMRNRFLHFSWTEEKKEMTEEGMKMLTPYEYLEAVATISLVKRVDKGTNFEKFYFSPETLPPDNNGVEGDFYSKSKTVIYSTNVLKREALIIDFPKEDFMSESLKPKEISFLIFARGQNEETIIEFQEPLVSLYGKRDVSYEVTSIGSL